MDTLPDLTPVALVRRCRRCKREERAVDRPMCCGQRMHTPGARALP
jgi:hypothetical protein